MAETKKKSGSKKSDSKSSKKSSSESPQKEPAKKSSKKSPKMPALEELEEKKEPETLEIPERIYSICLFGAGILTTLLIIEPGAMMWRLMHNAIKGMFGIPCVLIPFGLFLTAFQIDQKTDKEKIKNQLKFLLLGIVFLSCFIEIMFLNGHILDFEFFKCFAMLRQEGIEWKSGGMISALSYPVLKLFDKIGAKFIICLLLLVYVMLSSKKSLSELFQMIRQPFRNVIEFFREDAEDSELISEYEEEQEELEKLQDLSEQEAFRIAEQAASNTRPSPKNDSFVIDIPVSDEPPVYNEEELNHFFDSTKEIKIKRKSRKKSDSPETDENFKETKVKVKRKSSKSKEPDENQLELLPSLDDLINNAAQAPKKKTKEELRLDSILEIEDEAALQSEKAQDLQERYQMPYIDFLEEGNSHADDPNLKQELRDKANQLCEVLKSFNVEVNITNIARGPSVTRYEVQPAPGVKVSKITNLSDDIALNLAAEGVRIEAPIPGKPAIGIEVPNSQKDTVSLRELLEAPEFRNSKSKLTFGVGKDIAGNVIIGDIAKMPHMIIAGATGSGKSVCTNSIIMSILYHAAPDEVKLILIDPKIVEFRVYDGIPHLLIPVVTDPKKAAGALNWAVQEMLRRYDVFAKNSVRNLEDYNRICIEKPELNLDKMPQIVICIDELADLMMTASKEVEEAICRLAQLARAAGMHLIIATQRPTTDIITGLIKANIPSRIALSVMSQIDSRIILDTGGAEKLLGHGDMLYLPSGQPKPVRVQGCYVSTQEIENVVTFIKNQSVSETGYDEQIIQAVDQMAVTGDKKSKSSSEEPAISGDADLIEQAIEVVVAAGQASTSNLQRRLRLGYARAARIMDELESMGIIGAYEGAKPRKVLMSPLELEQRKMHRKGN